MITQAQHRQIDADMAVRLVHWLMDTPNLENTIQREREKARREKAIAEYYARGEKVTVIAKDHKCTHSTIKQACIKHGVPLRQTERDL